MSDLGYKNKLDTLVKKFVDDIAVLTKQVIYETMITQIQSTSDGGPLPVSEVTTAIKTANKKARKLVKKATKIAKKATKLAKKTKKKAQAEYSQKLAKRASKETQDNAKNDSRRAWRLRKKLKEGKQLTDVDLPWITEYNARNPM